MAISINTASLGLRITWSNCSQCWVSALVSQLAGTQNLLELLGLWKSPAFSLRGMKYTHCDSERGLFPYQYLASLQRQPYITAYIIPVNYISQLQLYLQRSVFASSSELMSAVRFSLSQTFPFNVQSGRLEDYFWLLLRFGRCLLSSSERAHPSYRHSFCKQAPRRDAGGWLFVPLGRYVT